MQLESGVFSKRRVYLYFLMALLFLFSAMLASCSALGGNDDGNQIITSLPSWPPYGDEAFPPLDHYQIRIASAGGQEVFSVPNGGKIMIETQDVTAVIVQPVTRHNGTLAAFFRPAGCVLPASANAAWEGGFSAVVCADIFLSSMATDAISGKEIGIILSKFNWIRFAQEMSSRSIDTKSGGGEEIVCDPWTLDKNKIINCILTNKFTASDITPTKASSNRAIKNADELRALNNLMDYPLLPRYIGSYKQQQRNGKMRLVSDKYAATIGLAGVNKFLCGESVVCFSLSIKGSGSNTDAFAAASVTPISLWIED